LTGFIFNAKYFTTHVPGTSRDAHEGRSKVVVHPPQPFAFGVDWLFSRHI